MPAQNDKRNLVIVSGYYGFANLGDEAILEEIVCELKRVLPSDRIVVLSAKPQETEESFAVRAAPRSDIVGLVGLMRKAQLLVSGGGGLFQDTKSPGSAIFYASHVWLARGLGARAVVYAQGVGPLHTPLARLATRSAFGLCDSISVRDSSSLALVKAWGLKAELTADPVWCLEPTPLPEAIEALLAELVSERAEDCPLVGLSLRPSKELTDSRLSELEMALEDSLPAGTRLLMLPLQKAQDEPLLNRFAERWRAKGKEVRAIDPSRLTRPSQWITLLSKLDLLVSMRLHALIMALRSAVPTVGIAYDPKVERLLTEFEQPILILTNESEKGSWKSTIKQAFSARGELSRRAVGKAEAAKKLACQNFNHISRILSMQSDP